MKKKPHLKFYLDNVKWGLLPDYGGLCGHSTKFPDMILDYDTLKLFAPTEQDYYDPSKRYWFGEDAKDFNELRQTVVLLMAAIHNEL